MDINKKELEIVSNETKDSIYKLPIVTPSIYKSAFYEFLANHNLEIKDENELSAEIIKMQCQDLTALQTQTSKSAKKLSENTNRAIDAIKAKDENVLNEVLTETKALRQEIEKLKESVYKDELTHAHNRKWLHDEYLNDNENTFNMDGVLAIIDLNFFKSINDTFGHVIGDKVLVFITNHLKSTRNDIIRYGGDEFIVLFPDYILESEAKKTLHELREKIISKKLKSDSAKFRVSFSFGIVRFQKGDELAEVLKHADKSMYEDKVQIKKRVLGI